MGPTPDYEWLIYPAEAGGLKVQARHRVTRRRLPPFHFRSARDAVAYFSHANQLIGGYDDLIVKLEAAGRAATQNSSP